MKHREKSVRCDVSGVRSSRQHVTADTSHITFLSVFHLYSSVAPFELNSLDGLEASSYLAAMNIAIGSDHAGFQYKERIKGLLASLGHTVKDFGTDSDAPVDYPVYIR